MQMFVHLRTNRKIIYSNLRAQNLPNLAHMLSEYLVEYIVNRESEMGLVNQQFLHQQAVQVVRVHDVIPVHKMLYRMCEFMTSYLYIICCTGCAGSWRHYTSKGYVHHICRNILLRYWVFQGATLVHISLNI